MAVHRHRWVDVSCASADFTEEVCAGLDSVTCPTPGRRIHKRLYLGASCGGARRRPPDDAWEYQPAEGRRAGGA